ncbi:MAG TPA: ABC transporter permease [Moraxellaceae bacterium]|nr:ABC transporter permease [Moraxellaceae bacterium]
MRVLDVLTFCTSALRRQRFRTIMLFIAMSIGVAAVIVLTGLGQGARGYVLNQFSALGTDILIVLPGKSETSGGGIPMMTGGTTRDLTLADSIAVTRLPQVSAVAPVIAGAAEAKGGDRVREAIVIGSTNAFFHVRNLALAQGQALPPSELDLAQPIAILGPRMRTELFGTRPALGEWIRLDNRRFRVIGVLAEGGESLGMNRSDMIIIPVAAAQQLFNTPGLFRLLILARPGANMAVLKTRVRATLTARHDGMDDVTLLTQDALLSSFGNILDTLTLAVAGIGAISLLVAGVLVMNVTLITVTQRTAEVGLLKALGASASLVARLFLTEAGLLSLLGALGGLGLGETLLWLGRRLFPDIPFAAPLWAELTALAVAVGTGLLFALLPARRAARLDPVTALAKK